MGKGQAVAGFVLGIVALILSFFGGWLSIVGLPLAIVGLVLSVVGGKKLRANNQGGAMATAGLVIGIIAVIITAILFFSCGICTLCAASVLL